ncbi:hypothetical protein GCM10010260_29890 [Streptomyces filipinensis]|uniref:ATP-binding protein n=1 Tax=Streptomyces filipinensis TaxID=66887 RepID=A0A918IA00_9ACTN|nr:AAA family ATPase [Streptomyces filipinensis]GGU93085.1 hypothetical protein GCM10010260_29890 [Streptomyces filipinensis]
MPALPAPGAARPGSSEGAVIATGDARRLYDEMRALRGRAETRRHAAGQPFSQREIEKALDRPPYSIKFRGQAISEWVPDDVVKAQVPHDADAVWALVRLWSDWAGDEHPDEGHWRNLVERAQPVRAPRSGRRPVGRPMSEYVDHLVLDDLEVHPCLEVGEGPGLGPLPAYVRREHDAQLRAVLDAVRTGASQIAVLVGGSSTGKTRACWEALEPLREAGGWRLWHPYDPTRPEAALEGLDRVGPRTVVWLNETQEYLGDGALGERVAAKLRSLLTDQARAPVLVLGTLWPQDYAALLQRPGSQVRLVLGYRMIEVPNAFTGADLAALRQAAAVDGRLAIAAERADAAQVTQYLAGGPELIERFSLAPPAPKAVIRAAMDLRRMGHGNALPRALLEAAAQAYLLDIEWEQLDDDWVEQALAYTSSPCKGVRGPVTRIRPRSGSRPPLADRSHGGPVYRLADYLDEFGRRLFADLVPPKGFWAAATRADPGEMVVLADAARARGMLCDAVRLYVHATERGSCTVDRDRRYMGCAAVNAVRLMDTLSPDDPRPRRWAAAYCSLDNAYDVDALLRSADSEAVTALLARNPASRAPLDRPSPVERLLSTLDELGAQDQVDLLLARNPASHVDAADRYGLVELLSTLHRLGAAGQVDHLARRGAATVTFRFLYRNSVFGTLSAVGAHEHAATLAARAAAEVSFTDVDAPKAVACVLDELQALGASEAIHVLLLRNPAQHVRDDGEGGLEALADALQRVRAHEQIAVLHARMAALADTGDPGALARVLFILRATGARDRVPDLLNRVPATRVDLRPALGLANLLGALAMNDAPDYVTALLSRNPSAHTTVESAEGLLGALRRLGADEQYDTLAQRIAREFPLGDPARLRGLLSSLQYIESVGGGVVVPNPVPHLELLLARDPAEQVELADTYAVAALIAELREIGAEDISVQLASRAATSAPLDDAYGAALLLKSLPTGDLVTRLLARDPATHVSISYAHNHMRDDVLFLVQQLRAAGAADQADHLLRRLVAAGRFTDFRRDPETSDEFRWGREPGGAPAEPWDWEKASRATAR